MDLSKGLREFIESLNSNKVEYVIVGGYAQAFHGRPRFTGDIDIAIRPSRDNALRLQSAISQFGFEHLGLGLEDFLAEGQVIQLGVAPHRIDLLTSLTGCDFDDVWATRIPTQISGVPVHMIGKEQYIRNKRAVGRSQDLADLETLG
jgi:predicted nucleotidyltransferase